jgi:peptide/nickel transport system substrate-binding protein
VSNNTAELDELLAAVQVGEINRQQFVARALAAGVSLGATSALLGGFAERAFAAPAVNRGGTIVISSTPPSYPISPWRSGDQGARNTFMPTINYLVRVLPNLKIVPELATKWVADPKAKTWTVTLRQGVKFHNGKPFTADDVVDTFDRLVDPDSGSEALGAFDFLKKGGTVKVNDHTVRFNLTRPYSGFPYSMFTYQAAILPAGYSGDYEKNPIGTGPFMLTKYTPKESAEFVKNPNYWQPGLPYLDGIRLVYFADSNAQIAALLGGSIQLMQYVSQDLISVLKKDSNIKILPASSASHAQLAMRTDRKPWTDKRVRQALALTLNRKQIQKNLMAGYGDIANDHMFAPIYPITKSLQVPQREQDYPQARRLLAQAGYPRGIDVELRTHPGLNHIPYATVIQAMAKPAGIRIKLKVEPDEIYFKHWNTIPFALESWAHRPWPSQLLNLAYRSGADWNVPHWNNKKFDALVSAFDATSDPRRQQRLAQQIATLMNDEVPAVISFEYQTVRATRSNVRNITAEPTDYIDLRSVWLD